MLLPTELVDHIFSFLRGNTSGSISALKACSKAHPMFSRLAQRHLYAHILIDVDWHNKNALSELYYQLSDNPHLLDFPRTLEFHHLSIFPEVSPEPKLLSIMSMIPRMTNLISLAWTSYNYRQDKDRVSTFRTCLQQSTIEELCLENFYDFPLSILDNGKTIKKLTLNNCTAMSENELILTSSSPHQSLETLIIISQLDPNLLFWASHRATGLTTLEFRGFPDTRMREIAELLKACSKNLTRLYLDIEDYAQSVYFVEHGLPGHWVGDHLSFPFTLSAHKSLREVSISAQILSNSNEKIYCELPAILRLIKSAPSIPDVVLGFHRVLPYISLQRDAPPIQRLDLSPLLDRLWSDFPAGGIRPRIDLNIHDACYSFCQTIHDVLAMTKDEGSLRVS